MPTLIDYLRAFNSKERFFLVGEVLGNQDFTLSENFRKKLNTKLKLSIPSDAFSAMDYHIDWIYASLALVRDGESIDTKKTYSNDQQIIKAQQEDIDWLIAFRDKSDHHYIILIEAKGVTGWINEQMTSKAIRFGQIFGENGDNWAGIEPRFVLMSPDEPPKGLVLSEWPQWMKPEGKIHWLPLKVPEGKRGIVRCNKDGDKGRDGEYWKTAPRKSGGEE